MEWLLVLAALACPIGMLAMGAIAWAFGKRAGRAPNDAKARSGSDGAAQEGALAPRA